MSVTHMHGIEFSFNVIAKADIHLPYTSIKTVPVSV